MLRFKTWGKVSTLQEDLMHLKTQITLLRNMREQSRYLDQEYTELRRKKAEIDWQIEKLQYSIEENAAQLPGEEQ